MRENKVNVCFIGSGIIPSAELNEYLKDGYNTSDIESADIAFKLHSVNSQDADRELKVALDRMIMILDEEQLKALQK